MYSSAAPVTTMAAPEIEYVTAAPQIEYVSAAPAVEYVTAAAPQVEYVAAAPRYVSQPVVEEFVIPAAPIKKGGPNNLLAMGNVVSERVVTPEELFQDGRFFEAEAERAPTTVMQSAPIVQAAPVMYETVQPQVIEYVTQPALYETVEYT